MIKEGENAALSIDNMEYNKNARINVAGRMKCGVGLNDSELTMAIICSDTKDVRQYEGRIRNTNNIVYHLVDNYKTFENHYQECETWYKNRGATIKIIGEKHEFNANKQSKIVETKMIKNT